MSFETQWSVRFVAFPYTFCSVFFIRFSVLIRYRKSMFWCCSICVLTRRVSEFWCRCLLGNESEKYVIENLYDFDLGIITITMDANELAEEWNEERTTTKSEPAIFDIFVKNICSFLPMCLFCHFSLCPFGCVVAVPSFPYFGSIQFQFVFILHPLALSLILPGLFLSKLKYIFFIVFCVRFDKLRKFTYRKKHTRPYKREFRMISVDYCSFPFRVLLYCCWKWDQVFREIEQFEKKHTDIQKTNKRMKTINPIFMLFFISK